MDDWANPSESLLDLADPDPQEVEAEQQDKGGELDPAEAGAGGSGGGFINHIISNLSVSIPRLSGGDYDDSQKTGEGDGDRGGSGATDGGEEVHSIGGAADLKAPRSEEAPKSLGEGGVQYSSVASTGGGIINHVISNLTGSIPGLPENQKKEEEDSTGSTGGGLISNLVSSLPVTEDQLSPSAEEASLLISIIQD